MGKPNELAHETGQRTQFVVGETNVCVRTIRVLGQNAVLSDVRIGIWQSLHATAAGKCTLANRPAKRIDWVVDQHGFEALTEYTITERDASADASETIRDCGYAFNCEERIKREQEIGAGITDEHGEIVGSLSVATPNHRWNISRCPARGRERTGPRERLRVNHAVPVDRSAAVCSILIALSFRIGVSRRPRRSPRPNPHRRRSGPDVVVSTGLRRRQCPSRLTSHPNERGAPSTYHRSRPRWIARRVRSRHQ